MYKTCSKCKEVKLVFEFHNQSDRKDGKRSHCKLCTLSYFRKPESLKRIATHNRNRYLDPIKANKLKKYSKNYHRAHVEEEIEYRKSRKDHLALMNKKYASENKHKRAANENKRRARKLNRTPEWLTDDDFWMMGEIYLLAQERSKLTGIEWHVDHIYPLKGKKVSGLHVPKNLRVITATENLRKGAKLIHV